MFKPDQLLGTPMDNRPQNEAQLPTSLPNTPLTLDSSPTFTNNQQLTNETEESEVEAGSGERI
jgi:hypothetical protein